MYDNPQHAVSIDPTQNFVLSGEMPYMTSNAIGSYINALSTSGALANYRSNYFGYDRSKASVKLLEYLGYGNYESFLANDWNTSPLMADLNHNILAYWLIKKFIRIFIVIANGNGFLLLPLMLII